MKSLFQAVWLSFALGFLGSVALAEPGASQELDLSDWDFGDGADAAPAEALPGASKPAPSQSAPPGNVEPQNQGLDLSDWDFGAGADDAEPAAAPAEEPPPKPQAELKQARRGETAVADFAAEPREVLAVFPEMPSFKVIPSQKDQEMFPCRSCHEWAESDRTPRFLQEPHNNFVLQHGLHGQGQFWCFTCHHLEGDGGLQTLEGEKVDFDEAYLICSQCHVQEARDWAFGAHGKRVNSWRGERKSLICTACHYQHRPGLTPREPMPGPKMRQGLARPDHWRPKRERGPLAYEPTPLWEAHQSAGGHP